MNKSIKQALLWLPILLVGLLFGFKVINWETAISLLVLIEFGMIVFLAWKQN